MDLITSTTALRRKSLIVTNDLARDMRRRQENHTREFDELTPNSLQGNKNYTPKITNNNTTTTDTQISKNKNTCTNTNNTNESLGDNKGVHAEPLDYPPGTLSEIVLRRGICNCSGHCGSSIIQISILFYDEILNHNLDFDQFGQNLHLAKNNNDTTTDNNNNNNKLWNEFFNRFLLKNNGNNNNEYNLDNQECFVDLLCLVFKMWKTVNIHNPTINIIEKPDLISSGNSDDWQLKLKEMVYQSQNDINRSNKINSWVVAMFDSMKPMYEKYYSQVEYHHETLVEFILNRLLRRIIIHNYKNRTTDQNGVSFQTSLRSQQLHVNNLSTSDNWKSLNVKELISACGERGKIEDFTLMELLVSTMRYMVECESTLEGNVKCINYQASTSSKERLMNEMKMNGIYPKYLLIQPACLNIYNSNRNKSMGKNKLTMCEISCIRLWTIESVCSKIKTSHRRGNTCPYRYFCEQVMVGLKKLAQFDVTFHAKLSKIRYIYTGVSNVNIDLDNNSRTMLGELIQTRAATNNNKRADYYMFDTFTSTSSNFDVALEFSVMSLINGGVVLEMSTSNLLLNNEIIFGDISWISEFPTEDEVLIGPAMINIWEMKQQLWSRKYNRYLNKNGLKSTDRKATTLFSAQIWSPSDISLYLNNLKKTNFNPTSRRPLTTSCGIFEKPITNTTSSLVKFKGDSVNVTQENKQLQRIDQKLQLHETLWLRFTNTNTAAKQECFDFFQRKLNELFDEIPATYVALCGVAWSLNFQDLILEFVIDNYGGDADFVLYLERIKVDVLNKYKDELENNRVSICFGEPDCKFVNSAMVRNHNCLYNWWFKQSNESVLQYQQSMKEIWDIIDKNNNFYVFAELSRLVNFSKERMIYILNLLKYGIGINSYCFGFDSLNINWNSGNFLFEIEHVDDIVPFSRINCSNKGALQVLYKERTKFLNRMRVSQCESIRADLIFIGVACYTMITQATALTTTPYYCMFQKQSCGNYSFKIDTKNDLIDIGTKRNTFKHFLSPITTKYNNLEYNKYNDQLVQVNTILSNKQLTIDTRTLTTNESLNIQSFVKESIDSSDGNIYSSCGPVGLENNRISVYPVRLHIRNNDHNKSTGDENQDINNEEDGIMDHYLFDICINGEYYDCNVLHIVDALHKNEQIIVLTCDIDKDNLFKFEIWFDNRQDLFTKEQCMLYLQSMNIIFTTNNTTECDDSDTSVSSDSSLNSDTSYSEISSLIESPYKSPLIGCLNNNIGTSMYNLAMQFLLVNINEDDMYPIDLVLVLVEKNVFNIEFIHEHVNMLNYRLKPELFKKFEMILECVAKKKDEATIFNDCEHLRKAAISTYSLLNPQASNTSEISADTEKTGDIECNTLERYKRKCEVILYSLKMPMDIDSAMNDDDSDRALSYDSIAYLLAIDYLHDGNYTGSDESSFIAILIKYRIFNIGYIKEQLSNSEIINLLNQLNLYNKFKLILTIALRATMEMNLNHNNESKEGTNTCNLWLRFDYNDFSVDLLKFEQEIKKNLMHQIKDIEIICSYWVGINRETFILGVMIRNETDLALLAKLYLKNIVNSKYCGYGLPYLVLKPISEHCKFVKMYHNSENGFKHNFSLANVVNSLKDKKDQREIIFRQKKILNINFRVIDVAKDLSESEYYRKYFDDNIFQILNIFGSCLFLSDFKFLPSFYKYNDGIDEDCIKILLEFDIQTKIIALQQFAIGKQIIDEFEKSPARNRNKKNKSFDDVAFWRFITYDTRIRNEFLKECQMLLYCNVFKTPSVYVVECPIPRASSLSFWSNLKYYYNKKIERINNNMIWGIYGFNSRWDKIEKAIDAGKCDNILEQIFIATRDMGDVDINTLESYSIDDETGKIDSNYLFALKRNNYNYNFDKSAINKIRHYCTSNSLDGCCAFGLFTEDWKKIF